MNDHPIALFPARALITEFDDFAGDLVSENRPIRRSAVARATYMQVGLANARGEDTQEHLSRARRGDRNATHREMALRTEDGSAHHGRWW
jgi:hypothetical protein